MYCTVPLFGHRDFKMNILIVQWDVICHITSFLSVYSPSSRRCCNESSILPPTQSPSVSVFSNNFRRLLVTTTY